MNVLNTQTKPSIKSTWKDYLGPLLTDSRIFHYMLEGKYGIEWQESAQRVQAQRDEKRRSRREKQRKAELLRKEYV